MIAPIAHRGPDADGCWVDAAAGVAFGFRRLSILDLSPLGHQPMHSPSGRFTIVYNGEVYNHPSLRRELAAAGFRFRGHSDTETMLAAFEHWGVAAATRRFIGMFAIALWDREGRVLHLIRDRVGIKPLFVWRGPGCVAFGSELKTLLALPEFDREIDREAVTAFLRYLYVPGPRSIFRRVTKLPPGHILSISDPAAPLPAPSPFWSLREVAEAGLALRGSPTDEEVVEEADALLTDAVGLRLLADVPVGALLSGGIDSSTVVALMQASAPTSVRTFTIGFPDTDYDESRHAARVARHLGTQHTELALTPAELEAVVPDLPQLFDEPLADPSQIPTFLVSRVARHEVTVALSGDGGDEIFGGYNRYVRGRAVLRAAAAMPESTRWLGSVVGEADPESLNRWSRRLARVLPAKFRDPRWGEKAYKLRLLAGTGGPAGLYRSLLSSWQDPASLVMGGEETHDPIHEAWAALVHCAPLDRMLLTDQLHYLPDDLLAKLDRASMAVSLEARVPLLDHRVVEFAWRLPPRFKIRGGRGKWLLRQVLYRRVPRELVERTKMGFSVPIERWLRGPLREWAGALLAPDAVAGGGVLDPAAVTAAWASFQHRGPVPGLGIWAILMFQAWHDRWIGSR